MSAEVASNNKGHDVEAIELTNIKRIPPSRQESRAGNRHSWVELNVCLPDLTHLTLMIDQRTQATEIMDIIIETLQLNPQEARRVLSLWLVSADLELQLKPNHCPTQLFSKWTTYLRKYTALSDKAVQSQQPLLHLRRNVYISRDEDSKVTDIEILELLFTEARCNIMDGTYPSCRDLIIKLAGILCAMQYGEFDEKEHTPDFYKSHCSILPLSIQNNSKTREEYCSLICFAHKSADEIDRSLGSASQESRQEEWFRVAYMNYLSAAHTLPYYGANQTSLFPVSMLSDVKSLIQQLIIKIRSNVPNGSTQPPNVPPPEQLSNLSTVELKQAYLSACCEHIPYYGCVFFDGYTERVKRSFLSNSWLPVSIGVNTDGIYIIDTEKEEPLLGILYEDLTWQLVEICSPTKTSPSGDGQTRRGVSLKSKSGVNKDKVSSMPSLLLQYPADPDEQSEGVQFQVLQIYTMSARLIDAFIENCSEMLRLRVQASPIPSPGPTFSPAGATNFPSPQETGDVVDGPKFTPPNRQSSVIEANPNREALERSIRGLKKADRLSCKSFSKDGKCLSG